MSEKHPVKWADQAMFEAAPMKSLTPTVHLISATPDPLGAIAAACRMYEGKPTYSLSEISKEDREHYWEQVKKTHLKAPLEFVDLHFFIEGVTRAFTHQLVRQRTAVYAQESLRFAVKSDLAAAKPPSYQTMNDEEKLMWDKVIENIESTYNYLIGQGIPAEDARGLLPHCTLTRVNYKTNLRGLLDHAGNRLCTQAQFEWRHVFAGIIVAMKNYGSPYNNWQFQHIANDGVFSPVCYSLGRCPFKADFDRQCTIRERVDRHASLGNPSTEWTDILPAEWMVDPTAGRRDA